MPGRQRHRAHRVVPHGQPRAPAGLGSRCRADRHDACARDTLRAPFQRDHRTRGVGLSGALQEQGNRDGRLPVCRPSATSTTIRGTGATREMPILGAATASTSARRASSTPKPVLELIGGRERFAAFSEEGGRDTYTFAIPAKLDDGELMQVAKRLLRGMAPYLVKTLPAKKRLACLQALKQAGLPSERWSGRPALAGTSFNASSPEKRTARNESMGTGSNDSVSQTNPSPMSHTGQKGRRFGFYPERCIRERLDFIDERYY